MKILAFEKEIKNAAPEEFAKHAKEEAKVLWDLYSSGFVREFYFRADEDSAVLVLETDSASVASDKLNELPFVSKKLIEFELVPLKPYPGFERLFEQT
ncbi:MAG: hypothetical protein KJO12_03750 [Ignavibacteria bacterium]|nr:hypothetical protein [Ignavibacteria bacterium]